MRLDTSQQMRTDMRLRMAPRMIQSMEILQLPLMALQERIDQELIENPMLVDLRESTTPEPEPEAEPPSAPAEDPTPTEAEEVDDWDSYGESHRLSRAALSEEADRKHEGCHAAQSSVRNGTGCNNVRPCGVDWEVQEERREKSIK